MGTPRSFSHGTPLRLAAHLNTCDLVRPKLETAVSAHSADRTHGTRAACLRHSLLIASDRAEKRSWKRGSVASAVSSDEIF
jgi:hypothetical protein